MVAVAVVANPYFLAVADAFLRSYGRCRSAKLMAPCRAWSAEGADTLTACCVNEITRLSLLQPSKGRLRLPHSPP